MHHFTRLFAVAAIIATAIVGCEKESDPGAENVLQNNGASRGPACSSFTYGDSVFYVREQKGDYIVSLPKGIAGSFSATPSGLQIDPVSGSINISKSETGLKYTVFFVPKGTKDTCTQNVTIAGIDLKSAIYDLSRNDTLVKAIYRGAPNQALPNGTGVDANDFDSNGPAGEPKASAKGVAINKTIPVINAKQTLRNGAVGPAPKNGDSQVVRLYYRINDASKKALNFIDVRLTYYAKYSDIPATTVARINAQNNPNGRVIAPVNTNLVKFLTRTRPPEIVIVGY